MMGVGQTLTDAQGFRLPPRQAAAGAEALRQQAIGLGLTHQMSETDVMRIVQASMSAGMTTQPVLKGILPGLADFAEVLKLRRGYDPAQSATISTEFAHLFGSWTAGTFNPMTNLLGRALAISPASPDAFLRLTSQFSGTLRPLYGTGPANKQRLINDSITTAALESEMGQGSRGGTQLARMVTQTIGKLGLTNFRASQSQGAMGAIQHITGVKFFDPKTGDFNGIANIVRALALTEKDLHNPRKAGMLFQSAFGAVGARQAGLLGDPTTAQRLTVLGNMLGPNGLPSLQSYQGASNATTQGRFNQAQANLNTAMTQLGILWLPIATAAANALAAFTAGLIQFSQQHQSLMAFVATFIAVTAAVSLVVGPLLMLAGVVALVTGATGLAAIVAAAAPFVLIIAAVVLAITGLVLVIMNWKTILGVVGGFFTNMSVALHNLLEVLGLIKKPPLPKPTVIPATPPVKPGQVQVTHPTGTTVGLPTYLYLAPIPGANNKPVHHPSPVHGHGRANGTGGGGATNITLNVHPGAVTVHTAAKDPHAVTKDVAQYLGDELLHTLTSGAPSILGLSPTLNTPIAR